MQIMTANGWRTMAPRDCTPAHNEDGRWRGELPSPQIKAYLAWIKNEIAELKANRIARRGHDRLI